MHEFSTGESELNIKLFDVGLGGVLSREGVAENCWGPRRNSNYQQKM